MCEWDSPRVPGDDPKASVLDFFQVFDALLVVVGEVIPSLQYGANHAEVESPQAPIGNTLDG